MAGCHVSTSSSLERHAEKLSMQRGCCRRSTSHNALIAAGGKMDAQASDMAMVDASNAETALPEATTPAVFPLLKLPRELRDQVSLQ